MIQLFRIILVSVINGWLAWVLSKNVYEGIKAGTIRHTDTDKICLRQKKPFGFLALTLLFAGIVLMLFVVWGYVVFDAINEMKQWQ
ncbi:MAG: hypothetical protein PHI97_20455 [Desulfobulbus sp.]|nr:hypothetical protein [Desulfobulbus sp.]